MGNGGRKRALEFLNASPGANWRRKFPWFCAPRPICVWPGESLAGIDLSAGPINVAAAAQEDLSPQFFRPKEELGRVYLAEIQLPKADLKSANLQDADLSRANLQDAVLWGANLQGANLGSANLRDANLKSANLQGVFLGRANLQDDVPEDYELRRALSARRNTILNGDESQVELESANLQGVSLEGADLQDAIFLSIDLRETRNLSLEALESDNPPLICNSPLPSDIEIKGGKDRDCDQLAIVLSERYPHFFNSLEDAETFIKEQREKTWK